MGTPAIPCADFSYRTDYDFTIFSAEVIPAIGNVPEICRIDGLIRPEVRFQVNMPTNWNGRFYMNGNGGYAGLQPGEGRHALFRDAALSNGFATAYTDTGHDASVFPWSDAFFKNLGAEVDYSYRGIYLTATTSQELVAEYYGQPDRYSYWDGCSTGGRQGLVFAQRFPEVFDGISAGAPALNFTDTMLAFAWNALALKEAEPFTDGQMSMISDKVHAKCDAADGLEDGLIRDPRQCTFDVEADLPRCDDSLGDNCVSDRQAAALKKIYGGVQSLGKTYFPGLQLSIERGNDKVSSGWNGWLLSDGPSRQESYGRTFLENLAFIPDDPSYDWTTFNFDEDPGKISLVRKLLDATNPDLSRFRDAGGRMITYFGWADPALNPLMGIDYYEEVMAATGDAQDFYRFFTVPGMYHCNTGYAPEDFDTMSTLIDWVENGVAPDSMVAVTQDDPDGDTQLLCPYPHEAVYSGAGDAMDAANWSCGN